MALFLCSALTLFLLLHGRDGPRCPQCNIILVSLDTLRADRLGSYGYDRPTSPAIDAQAEQSFVFLNAIAQYTVTTTSHRSLFGGRHFSRGVRDPTLAEILAERGYRTAAFTGGGYLHRRYGHDRGFEEYSDDILYNGLADITPRALAWLDENRGAPFFLFLHTYDAHCPYTPPEPYFSMFAGDYRPEFTFKHKCGFNFFNRRELSEEDLEFLSAVYDGGVRWIDSMMKVLFDAFDRNDLRNTILVLTSDHGESLGDRTGFVGHGNLLEEQIRVPLIIRVPGEPPLRIREPVQLIDVLPTLLGLLGIEPPPDIDGVDLTPILFGESSFDGVRPRLTTAPTDDLAFRLDDTWKLVVRRQSDHRELYNLKSDPLRNVIAANRDVAARLEVKLHEYLERTGPAVPTEPQPSESDMEPELAEQLRELGYAE